MKKEKGKKGEKTIQKKKKEEEEERRKRKEKKNTKVSCTQQFLFNRFIFKNNFSYSRVI